MPIGMLYPGNGNLKNKKNIEMPPKKTLKFGKSADARRKHVARASATEAKQKTS